MPPAPPAPPVTPVTPAHPPWPPCSVVKDNPLWFIGVLLDCIATLAGTGGKQLLRYAVITKNPWYYPLGLICTAVIDPAFDVAAYGFAAQSIVAPMAGMVVVWNILIAPWTLGEALTRSRKFGALLIITGTLFVGRFGNHEEHERSVDEYLKLFSSPVAVTYYLVFSVWTVVCCYYWAYGAPFVSGFSVGALGGSLAGNMFTTKAVVEMMKCVTRERTANPCDAASCTYNPFHTVYPYVFIFISLTFACISLWMLAVGLRTFEALYMITVFEGFMIISGSISGNLVMYEIEGQSTNQLMLYSCAVGFILVGLKVLLHGEGRNDGGGRLLTNTVQPVSDVEAQSELRRAHAEAVEAHSITMSRGAEGPSHELDGPIHDERSIDLADVELHDRQNSHGGSGNTCSGNICSQELHSIRV